MPSKPIRLNTIKLNFSHYSSYKARVTPCLHITEAYSNMLLIQLDLLIFCWTEGCTETYFNLVSYYEEDNHGECLVSMITTTSPPPQIAECSGYFAVHAWGEFSSLERKVAGLPSL